MIIDDFFRSVDEKKLDDLISKGSLKNIATVIGIVANLPVEAMVDNEPQIIIKEALNKLSGEKIFSVEATKDKYPTDPDWVSDIIVIRKELDDHKIQNVRIGICEKEENFNNGHAEIIGIYKYKILSKQ